MNARNEFEIDLNDVINAVKDDPCLPNPELLNFYRMNKERKLWFDLQVGENTLEYERMIMLWNMEDKEKPVEERKPIWIYLVNFGGDFNLEWAFIDMINMSKTPIYTVNMGVCASAAADIFISGHQRFMTQNARIMIHQGNMSISADSQKVFDAIDDYKRQLDKTKKYIISRTGITNSAFKKHETNDWWLDSDECLKLGVCDKVVESIDDII